MSTPNDLWRATGIPHWQADCARCSREISDRMVAAGEMEWFEAAMQPMWVCPLCGSKRCAQASFHGNACDEGEAEREASRKRDAETQAEIERRGITRSELMQERIAAFLAED